METKQNEYREVANALYLAASHFVLDSQSQTYGVKRVKGRANETRLEAMARTCGCLAEDVLSNRPEIKSTDNSKPPKKIVQISRPISTIAELVHVNPHTFKEYMIRVGQMTKYSFKFPK